MTDLWLTHPDDGAGRLLRVAYDFLGPDVQKLSPTVEKELIDFVVGGATSMATGLADRDPADSARAEDNLLLFLGKLRENVLEGSKHTIDMDDFSAARLGLCPLWPFCLSQAPA